MFGQIGPIDVLKTSIFQGYKFVSFPGQFWRAPTQVDIIKF